MSSSSLLLELLRDTLELDDVERVRVFVELERLTLLPERDELDVFERLTLVPERDELDVLERLTLVLSRDVLERLTLAFERVLLEFEVVLL